MKICFLIAFIVFGLATVLNAQHFEVPPMPVYDSLAVDAYGGKVLEKTYFKNGERVFEIGYNTGSMFYTPFAHIGGGEEDSCYAYFDKGAYDLYYLSEDYIKHEKFAENSYLFQYKKINRNNQLLEQGNYHIIKELHNTTTAHNSKYKIGQWEYYDKDGKLTKTIDYDKFEVDGKEPVFTDSRNVLHHLKNKADQKIIEVYGKKFFDTYIRFNPDRSGYFPFPQPRPEQPGGYSIFRETEKDILFVDLTYDIVFKDQRFNVIMFRIDKNGAFLGETYFKDFGRSFQLTNGLDKNNTGKFHRSVLNWKAVAKQYKFDITRGDFNIRMATTHEGEREALWLILEQPEETIRGKNFFTRKLRQIKINPWTGDIIEQKEETGLESEISEG